MRAAPPLLALVLLSIPACAGDDGVATEGATAGTSTAGTSTADTTSEASTTTTSTSGGETAATTTAGTSTEGTSTEGTSTASDTTSESESDTGLDCAALPPGPLTAELVTSALDGSEDLAFDGLGHLAGKSGDAVVLVDAADTVTPLASPVPKAYGLRYRVGGDLVVALPNDGKLLQITPGGQVSDLVTGLQGPNGVFPDLDGNVWVTEFAGSRVIRVNPDLSIDTIVAGPEALAANGVVFDAARRLLFYTNYSTGRIVRVAIDDQGEPGAPEAVLMVPGAPDGVILDACGNLYVVDQSGSDLYRIHLDDQGVAVDAPELLAELPSNVANPQFGRGDGFDPESLYLAGNPGDVYRVAVGVGGIAIP